MRHVAAPIRRFTVCILGIACVLVYPLLSPVSGQPPGAPSSSASADKSSNKGRANIVKGRLLAINDFHGALEPPLGSGGLVRAGAPVAPGPANRITKLG